MLHYDITPKRKLLSFLWHMAISNKYKSWALGPIPAQQHREERAGTLNSSFFQKGSQKMFNE